MKRDLEVWVTAPPASGGDGGGWERWRVGSVAELRLLLSKRFGAASSRFDIVEGPRSLLARLARIGRPRLLAVPAVAGGEENMEKVFLEIPKNLIQEPIIHTLGTRFEVVPNIRAGSITETIARIALELTGPPDEVRKAVDYLRGLGISVEPIQEK